MDLIIGRMFFILTFLPMLLRISKTTKEEIKKKHYNDNVKKLLFLTYAFLFSFILKTINKKTRKRNKNEYEKRNRNN